MLSSIQDILPRLQEIADGNKTTFVADFPLLDQNFVLVYLNDSKSESGFSVDSGSNTVTFDTAPESGTIITIVRAVPTSWEDTGNSRGAMDKDAFDRTFTFLVCKMQTLKEELSRCLKTPIYSDKSGEQLSEFFLTQLTDALDVLDRAQDSLSLIQSTSSSALSSINDALDNALSQIEGKVTAAGASADRAEQEADRAQTIVDSAVDNINTARDEALAQLNPERFYTKEEANGTFVALKGNQTASGDKTWTGTQIIKKNGMSINIKNPNLTIGENPSSEGYNSILFSDKDGNQLGLIDHSKFPEGNSFTRLLVRDTINGEITQRGVELKLLNNGDSYANISTNRTFLNTPNDAKAGEATNAEWVLNKISQSKPENVVDYTRITNCLTEIPQDIKLELADGTLKLKAGSKVYNMSTNSYSTANTDVVFNAFKTSTGKCVLFVNSNASVSQGFIDTNNTYSGSSVPSGSYANNSVFFNTTDKKFYIYQNGWSEWGVSILGVATLSNGSVTSIDRTFNGFGYIGNTVFALPGVKGLIPNGVNTNGSLNSIERTSSSIAIKTLNGTITNGALITNLSGTLESSLWFSPQARDYPDSYTGRYYNYAENYIKLIFSRKWSYQSGYMLCAYFTADSTGRITSLTPNTAFHAVDYNEYAREVGRCAKLDEDNTFTKANKFSQTIYRKRSNYTKPSAYTELPIIQDEDDNGKFITTLRTGFSVDGSVRAALYVKHPNSSLSTSVYVQQDENGKNKFMSITPDLSASSNEGVTAAWVNNKFKVVSTLPAEPDPNVFYFIPEV